MAVREIDHKELGKLVRKCYETNTAHMVSGATGIGKSWQVDIEAREIAKTLGREYVKWNRLSKGEKVEVSEHPEKYLDWMYCNRDWRIKSDRPLHGDEIGRRRQRLNEFVK